MEREKQIEKALRELPLRRPSAGFRGRVMAAVAAQPAALPSWLLATALSCMCAWAAVLTALAGWTLVTQPEPLASLWRDPAACSTRLELKFATALVDMSSGLLSWMRLCSRTWPQICWWGVQTVCGAVVSAAVLLPLACRPAPASRRMR